MIWTIIDWFLFAAFVYVILFIGIALITVERTVPGGLVRLIKHLFGRGKKHGDSTTDGETSHRGR